MFRWKKLENGRWLGLDGANWYRIASPSPGSLEIESNASKEDAERLFRLDWDAEDVVREILAQGPELVPYIGSLRGLRIMRPSCATETFFCFLCTANNNLSRIVPMCWELGRYGAALATVDGVELHAFPEIGAIAEIPEAELRGRGFGYRGATIPAVARQVLERGEGWFDYLRDAPYEAVHRELVEIKGIGPKLADCISLFAFDKTESVPLDTHIWQAFTRLYYPEWKDKAVTASRYREATSRFRERFGKRAGWAHQYLFYDNVLNWRDRR